MLSGPDALFESRELNKYNTSSSVQKISSGSMSVGSATKLIISLGHGGNILVKIPREHLIFHNSE